MWMLLIIALLAMGRRDCSLRRPAAPPPPPASACARAPFILGRIAFFGERKTGRKESLLHPGACCMFCRGAWLPLVRASSWCMSGFAEMLIAIRAETRLTLWPALLQRSVVMAQTSFFFGYMGMVCFGFWLMLGLPLLPSSPPAHLSSSPSHPFFAPCVALSHRWHPPTPALWRTAPSIGLTSAGAFFLGAAHSPLPYPGHVSDSESSRC